MDATCILSAEEVQRVLRYFAKQSPGRRAWTNLAIFRLSCCCGLRRKEIAGLNLGDVVVAGPRPCIRVSASITKGREGKRRSRIVPLWWDEGTRRDLEQFIVRRKASGATASDPLICCTRPPRRGQRMALRTVDRRWSVLLVRVLGRERAKQLSIHKGRHSFITHALHVGRSLVEVQRAAGHASIEMTSRYAHLLERENIPDLFGG